jgi:ABC-type transport system involved in cytochrome c biogenesis permease subunit
VAALVVMMMAATVLEKLKGTDYAMEHFYHSPLFIALWGLAAICGLLYIFSRKMRKSPFTLGLHLALAVILAGALVTHLSAESGSVCLLPGVETECEELPFSITLDRFRVDYHPGSEAPSDFVSEVKIDNGTEKKNLVISMNKIGKVDGWRLYQADYDKKNGSSTLAFSHDPWGIGISYTGYLLLLICMVGFFFQKNSAFKAALRRLLSSAALLLLFVPGMSAQDLGDLYLYYGDRICPLQTLSRHYGTDELLENRAALKIFPIADSLGKVSWYACDDELPADLDYEEWLFVRKSLDLLRTEIKNGNKDSAEELIGKIRRYQRKKAAAVIPSDSAFKAEKFYNCISRPSVPFMATITLGLIFFVLFGIRMAKGKAAPEPVRKGLVCYSGLLLCYLSLAIGLRWFISGHVPLSGGYNIMMLMAWMSCLAHLLLSKKMPLTGPLTLLLAGFTMLMASLSGPIPKITPIMPVLQSPLLSVHVLSMMLSYTLFGLAALNGIMGTAIPGEASEKLKDISLVILYPAVFLLTAGTFIGAVWANISWGSYWTWDPKETWALITLMVYAAALHGNSLPFLKKGKVFHAYCIIAFLCVLITYFGVNLLLGGMHSYA